MSTGQPADRLWLCMTDSNRTRILSRALAKGLGMTVYLGPTMDEDGPIAIVVADDAHAANIATARRNAAPGQRSILVTASTKQAASADIFLNHDIDAGTLANAIQGARAFRDHELATNKAHSIGTGLIDALESASFKVHTVDEAADLAIFLSRATPRPFASAVGFYVLISNAIEHGNLEFTAEEKAKRLAEGKWAQALTKRLGERAYADRRVKLEVQRGRRVLSVLIQDDGEGFDAETAEMANPAARGYRGRSIKMAQAAGFAQVSYHGIGNTLEASLVLPDGR